MAFMPHGIIPALVTPFNADESLDEQGLRDVVEHVIRGGVHGVFAAGTQGEFYALDDHERQRVFEIVVEQAAGRVPVYAGTGAPSTAQAIRHSKAAAHVGADVVTVLTPYFIKPTQQELLAHYMDIARAVSLPVMLYANPGYSGVALESETVRKLASVDNIVGIKDSSGDLGITINLVEHTPADFSVIVGNDGLIFDTLAAGGQGAIAATANVVPRLVSCIYDDMQRGAEESAQEKQALLAELRATFSLGTFPVVVKEAMEILGICSGRIRRPVAPLSADARRQLTGVIDRLAAYH
jgi:4-hydroxy-tetrahydrodipicolinate synthase